MIYLLIYTTSDQHHSRRLDQKESRLRELIRYMFYSVQTEFDSVQSADKLSALKCIRL